MIVYPGQPPAYPQQNQGAYPAQSPGYVAEQQPYPAQPYPAQPYPGQPYPAQPYPAQPYPAQIQSYPQSVGYPATEFKQYPPDYNYPQPGVSQYPPTAQQQALTNMVVVQPQPTVSMQPITYGRTGDYFLTLSIVMSGLCCIFGGWWNLLFTIPAVMLAGSAKSDASHGRTTSAQQKSKIALGLNVLAVLLYIVGVALIVGLSSKGVSLSSSSSNSGYSGYSGYSYYNYYYYCSYCNDYYGYCYYGYGYSYADYYSYSYAYYDYYSYYCD
eukprot:Em0003g1072a